MYIIYGNVSRHSLKSIMEKERRLKGLLLLGNGRQNKCYEGYKNLIDIHNGKYESDFVSPYTKSACNVFSEIVVLLQDWASLDGLKQFKAEIASLGHDPNIATNKNLFILLNSTFNKSFSDIFATNIFPYIKLGQMNSDIPQNNIDKAFVEFCLPQIKIVKPKLVICCGKKVFTTVAKYFGDPSSKSPHIHDSLVNDSITYYYQRHPSPLAVNKNGGIEQMKKDWALMKNSIF